MSGSRKAYAAWKDVTGADPRASFSLSRSRAPSVRALLACAVERTVEQVRETPSRDITSADYRRLVSLMATGLLSGRPDPELLEAASRDATMIAEMRRSLYSAMLAEWEAQTVRTRASDVLPVLKEFVQLAERLDAQVEPAPIPDYVTLAHDLRSPLTSIVFLSDTLQAGTSGTLNGLQRHQLNIISAAALGMFDFVNDLIEFSQTDNGLGEQTPSAFTIRPLFESLRDLVRPLAAVKDLNLRIEPGDLGRRLGYPASLSRVLVNLLTNALKYTDRGMVKLSARDVGDDFVEFSVSDTGRGLEPELYARLESPFRRGAGSNPAIDGYGLGLLICRKYLTSLDSRLEFENRRGGGSRFFFRVHLEHAPA